MGTTKKRHLLSVIQKVLITCVMLVVISPFLYQYRICAEK